MPRTIEDFNMEHVKSSAEVEIFEREEGEVLV
jgi:hypothetical protein